MWHKATCSDSFAYGYLKYDPRSCYQCTFHRQRSQHKSSLFHMSSLEQLPDELLLEIIQHVQPSGAPKPLKDYSLRLKDHTGREPLLLSLCQVSKRFFAIVEPVLYSALVIEVGHWQDFPRSYCIFSALLAKPARAKYVKCIRDMGELGGPGGRHRGEYRAYNMYNEGRLDKIKHCSHVRDWTNNTDKISQMAQQFWHGKVLKDWVNSYWTQPGQALMALLIAMAPNLAELKLHARTPLLEFVRPAHDTQPAQFSLLASAKLVKLTFGPAIDYHRPHGSLHPSCRELSSFLRELCSLKYYHGQYFLCHRFFSESEITSRNKNLRVLKLDKCMVSISELANVIRNFPVLQEFNCYLGGERTDWIAHGQSLISALESIQTTLEILDLEMVPERRRSTPYNQIDDDDSDSDDFVLVTNAQEASSFAQLTNLKSLTLSDCMLLGVLRSHDSTVNFRPSLPISHHIPRSIQCLRIRKHLYDLADDSFSLWDLADDVHLFPALSTVEVLGTESRFTTSMESTAELVARFNEQGVQFVLPI
jgi:hypothetical protein